MENEERAEKARVLLCTAEMLFKDDLIIHIVISKENEMVLVSNIDDGNCTTTLKNVVTELDKKIILENIQLKEELDRMRQPTTCPDPLKVGVNVTGELVKDDLSVTETKEE